MVKRAGPGRPKHEPTKEQREAVQVMAAAGVNHDSIATIIGVSDETLRKHYATELAHGNAKIVAAVAGALIKRALGQGPDAVNAQKFFLERRGGDDWRAKQEVTHRGAIGRAGDLTDAELADIAAGSSEGTPEAPGGSGGTGSLH